ncbi:hypothetical protein FRC08_014653, partial [Ceratobasidium sp. 394]
TIDLPSHDRNIDDVTDRIRIQDLGDVDSSRLPREDAIVLSLDWRGSMTNTSQESILLRVDEPLRDRTATWWISFERLPDAAYLTSSYETAHPARPNSVVRARAKFTNQLTFGHVLSVAHIFHEVAGDYFRMGAESWFYAAVMFEMLAIKWHPDKVVSTIWTGGEILTYRHENSRAAHTHHEQYREIDNRVQRLIFPPKQFNRRRPLPGPGVPRAPRYADEIPEDLDGM